MPTSPYALENRISLIVDKSPDAFTRQDLLKVIETERIEQITFHYTALDGKLKELKLPVTNRDQAERILADGERVDGSSLFGEMVDVALSDLYVIPAYRTAFINPFDRGSLDMLCRYIDAEGNRASFTLDNILNKASRVFNERTGLTMEAMGELEFFLIFPPATRIYAGSEQRGYHASAPFVKTGALLNEIVHHLMQITGCVKYAHSEVGYIESVRSNLDEIKEKQAEQLEIELLPTPLEQAGDNLAIARWLIRNIAFKHGCVATFAPKLEEGVAGNGFHIHMALQRDGRNIMTDPSGRLSEEARKLVGGLCHYADSLTAFGNTVSSAYLRLVPNQEAPTRICWSDLNRSAMIRVPLGWAGGSDLALKINPQQEGSLEDPGGRQTIELRSPDGSAIFHLLLAGLAMAAEWGLSHPESLEIAEKLYVTGNIFRDEALLKTLPTLPPSCVESSRLLLKKRDLYERDGVFPSGTIDYVAALLAKEDDEKMNVTLSDVPADDRLHETRKIMHKDLHRH